MHRGRNSQQCWGMADRTPAENRIGPVLNRAIAVPPSLFLLKVPVSGLTLSPTRM